MKKRVAIIGAGPAGLTAAYELLYRFGDEYEVYLLEKDVRVGGLAQTVPCGGFRLDLGGHRYFSKDQRIVDWWRRALPDGRLLDVDRSSKIFFRGKLIDYPLSLSLKTVNVVGVTTGARIVCSYLLARMEPRDERSLEDFYINRFGETLYRTFFADYTEKVWGRGADSIPSDWGHQRVKGLSFSKAIRNAIGINKSGQREISLTGHFYYPCNGSGYLWEQAAERVRALGGTVILNKAVRELHLEQNHIHCLRLADGTELEADHYLSSMPLRELVSAFSEAPGEIRQIAGDLAYRDFVLVGLLLEREAIRGTALEARAGELIETQWLYIQESSVKMGRVQLFNQWSPHMVSGDGIVLGVEYFCQSGDADWTRTDSEWVELALFELKRLELIRGDSDSRDAKVCRVEKAYPCYWGGYQKMAELKDYLNGIENLCCIGRNGQHRYNNLDHSMETAFRAVEFLRGRAEKSQIWEVNTDSAYHESKS